MNLYEYFVDEMEEGKFKSFRHEPVFFIKKRTYRHERQSILRSVLWRTWRII